MHWSLGMIEMQPVLTGQIDGAQKLAMTPGLERLISISRLASHIYQPKELGIAELGRELRLDDLRGRRNYEELKNKHFKPIVALLNYTHYTIRGRTPFSTKTQNLVLQSWSKVLMPSLFAVVLSDGTLEMRR